MVHPGTIRVLYVPAKVFAKGLQPARKLRLSLTHCIGVNLVMLVGKFACF